LFLCYQLKKLYNENKVDVVLTQPELIEIEYTDDIEKLYPKVRTVSSEEDLRKYLNEGKIENDIFKVKYSFTELGRYKRKEWSFQKEWRYIYSVSPVGLKELNSSTFEKHREIIRRIEDKEYEPAYSRMFFDLDDKALENIEVLCGPKMNDAEKIIVKTLLNQYCPNGIYKESKLKIRK